MNSFMNSEPRKLSTQGKIFCTTKGLKALNEDSKLKGRERQYCLLLSRGDDMSHFISEQLRQKVDLAHLLEEGYIEIDETDEVEIQLSKSSPVSFALDNNDKEKEEEEQKPEVDAILRLLAGNI
ncbi:hypothetical protein [Psychrobacter sp. I-STPA10]|uniref:hypothetical protein n=1 Tax=Psychrobacter sp. I-STPA10 TaxID=2585769 RepID=UPI001E3A79ED|nr:hypothetical protein [Psychrobacter sp. I-STPA10]